MLLSNRAFSISLIAVKPLGRRGMNDDEGTSFRPRRDARRHARGHQGGAEPCAWNVLCQADRRGRAYPQDEFEILYSELVRFYGDHACVHSKVYDGIPSLLSAARDRGLKLGVLSNKADPLVQEIVSTLFPAGTFDFVHGLVEGEKPKPENNAIQGFIGLCNGQEGDVTIIGDSEVDWQTALRAGCRYIVVSYGYRTREELSKSGVDVIADTTGEVEDRLWK